MLLSTQTGNLAGRFGDEEAVRRLADAGYDCLDYSMFHMSNDDSPMNGDDYRERAQRLREVAEESGVFFNQAHCPFTFKWDDPVLREKVIIPRHIRALEIASILGVKNIIVHPLHHFEYKGHEKEAHDMNMDFYRMLLPYCEKFGINVALENMWQRDRKRKCICDDTCSRATEFAAWIDELNDPHFVACLDLGHCGLVGEEAQDAIRTLGAERLKALHVHDNDYINDQHTLPFLGKMDWKAITAALREIGYTGELTFEADAFLRNYLNEDIGMATKFMVQTGRRLIEMIEG